MAGNVERDDRVIAPGLEPETAQAAADSAAVEDRNAVQDYVDRVIARARELRASDAFAPATRQVGYTITAAQAKRTTRVYKLNNRYTALAFLVALIVVAAISLFLPYEGIKTMGGSGSVYGPDVVFAGYDLWFKTTIMPLFDPSLQGQVNQLYADFSAQYGTGTYTYVINRLAVTVIAIACGIMLAVSGALFQTAFQNPLATPTMLGVSEGVTVGCIIYTMTNHLAIGDDPVMYTLLVYGCGALAVVVVLLFSRLLSGSKRFNVVDMLLLGTVICQLLGGVSAFIQTFVMDDTMWSNFYDTQQAADALTEPVLQVIVIVLFAITFIAAFVLRFRLNLVAFDNDEGNLMGARANALRIGALVLGSVMQLAALASVGQVAMLSLAVPFLVRYLMPADFRSQFLGNCLVGSLLLLVVLVVQHFAVIGYVIMPVGTLVSIVIIPFFVWVVVLSKARWV